MIAKNIKSEEKNPQLSYDVKIIRIKKMYKLLDMLKRAQLGSDKQSRVEYRFMEKQLVKNIEVETAEALQMIDKHNLNHSPKDFLKYA